MKDKHRTTHINLKRLISKKNELATKLIDLIHDLDASLAIQDVDGEWLLGSSRATRKYAIEADGAVLGWVMGDTHAATLATLLTRLIHQETEKKSLAHEVLGLYREINLLFNLSEKLSANLDSVSVARTGLDEAHSLIAATHGAIILFDEAEHTMRSLTIMGDATATQEQLDTVGGILRDVARSGKPEIVNHAQLDARYVARGVLVNALACAPLKAKHQVIGLIVLLDTDTTTYTAADLKLLNTLAALVGPAIDSALLYEKTLREGQAREQRLQQESQVKSALLGVITHELRSPFVSAEFSAQLLRKYAERAMYSELQEQIRQLERELAQGRQMIDGVVSFASLMSKQAAMRLEPTDMASLIRQTVAPLEKMAETRNIQLSFELSAQLPLARVDRERMGEAIYHLAHNAIKFNVDGGAVQIACWAADAQMTVLVQDTGIGIAPEKLETIWEAFAQDADQVRRGVEGLGLGLALVKFVAQAHGGKVIASSTLGKGSRFGFQIPI